MTMPALTYQELNNQNPEKIFNIKTFVLNSQNWQSVRPDLNILFKNWKKYKFDEHIQDYLPNTKGIYIFFVEPNFPFLPETRYLMYVGEVSGTNTFHNRFYDYVSGIGSKKHRRNIQLLTNLWPDHTWVYVYELNLPDKDITDIEDNLIDNINPPMNNKFKAKAAKNSRSIYN